MARIVLMIGTRKGLWVATSDEGRTSWELRGPDELRSEDRVTVTQGDSILAGTGLRADMKAKRFQLLNQVTARYVPR